MKIPMMKVRYVHSFLNLIFSFVFAFSHGSFASDIVEFESTKPVAAKNDPQLLVKFQVSENKDAVITAMERENTSPEQIQKLLQDPSIRDADILISTDQESVAKAAVTATSSPKDQRLLRIIPIGKLASAKQKIASGFNSYYRNAKATLTGDRIGLTVLAITVGMDSFIWIHSTSFDIHQKSAMVMMNLVMAATFGLDRDLWGKLNSPLKNRLIRIFDKIMPHEKLHNSRILAGQYLSNFTLGMGVQLTRTGLLSLDHINEVVNDSSFYFTAAKIAGLITLTTFAWSELLAAVNAEKNPVAKLMLKRLAETRGILMAHLASISMVLQPHIYGSTPIYSFVIHGTLGIIALANAHRIVNWLETNSAVNKIYRKVQTFESFINSTLNMKTPQGRFRCQALFSP
jgi:hypothetical protein